MSFPGLLNMGASFVNKGFDLLAPEVNQEREKLDQLAENKKYAIIALIAAVVATIFASAFSVVLSLLGLALVATTVVGVRDSVIIADRVHELQGSQIDSQTKAMGNAVLYAVHNDPAFKKKFYDALFDNTFLVRHFVKY